MSDVAEQEVAEGGAAAGVNGTKAKAGVNEAGNMGTKWALKTLVLVLVAGFPFAVYIIGNSYHEAYLAAYGIDSQGLPLSIQSIYIKAYESLTLNFLDASLNITRGLDFISTPEFISVFILVSILFVPWVMSITKPINVGSMNDVIEENISEPVSKKRRVFAVLLLPPFLSAGVFAGVCALCLSLFLGLISLYKSGSVQAEKRANEAIAEFRKNNGCFYKDTLTMWSNCHQLLDSNGKLVYEGILVVQTDNKVAFYNGEYSVSLEIPSGAVIKNAVNPDYKIKP